MSTAQRKTFIELDRLGAAALDQSLGPVEIIRFLRLLHPGSGDYTAERQKQMDQDPATVDDLCEMISNSQGTTSPTG